MLFPSRELVRVLVSYPKPIVAGVQGACIGLGATLLPLFDVVYASDSAHFCLPYAKLGQVPEGGATYTFPTLLGKLQVGLNFFNPIIVTIYSISSLL